MKLVHLAMMSIVACLLGLVALLLLTFDNARVIQERQAEIRELLVLGGRIDDFSVASDSLLLFGATPDLREAYLAEARALRNELQKMGSYYPDALEAARHLEIMTRQLEDIIVTPRQPDSDGSQAAPQQFVPLELPERSRIFLNHIAGHGIALDTAVGNALHQRQQAITREVTRAGATLLVASLLFGALAVIAFGLIHRRMAAPMRELTQVLKTIRAGDLDARAPVRGNDEVANLAHTLNQMLDYRSMADKRLRHYRQIIEGSEDLSGVCDAEFRYVLVNRAYAERYSLEPEQIEGRYLWELMGEEQFAQVRPAIERCFSGEMQQFETLREFDDLGSRSLLARYFPIVAPDGQRYVAAVIMDITEQKETEAQMQRQTRLLGMAGHAARFGGWSVDLASRRTTWSDMTAEIHGMPHGYSPTYEEGLAFYAPDYRGRIQELFKACIEAGEPFDDELQIVNANGEPVWVRAVGEAVYDESGEVVRIQGAFQDISTLKSAERAKEKLSRRLADMLESITDAFIALDHEWRFVYVNPEAERLTGRPADELIGQNLWEVYPDAADMEFGRAYKRAMEQRVTEAVEGYYPPLEKWLEVRAYPTPEGLAIYFHDVSDRHQLIEQLQKQKASLRHSHDQLASLLESRRALINSLPAHIALLDNEGTIIDVNDQWRHFGRENAYPSRDFGVGQNYLAVCDQARGDCAEEAAEMARGLRRVLSGEREKFALEYPCHSPDEFRWYRVMVNQVSNPGEEGVHTGFAVMHVDITERKLAEQKLSRLAYEDPLTGQYSRTGFTRALSEYIEQNGWQAGSAVVMLNIKDTHDINETLGYSGADQLLVQTGKRLRGHVGESGIVGRTGGDEFAVFIPGEHDSTVEQQQEALTAIFRTSFKLGEHSEILSSARYGITRLGEEPRDPETLLREAELALFHCQEEEIGDEWALYSRELKTRSRERIEITRELRHAAENGELELHFQPKVDLASGNLIACEALLRWHHPEHGLMPPGKFIPVAEQSQLIRPIGEWVIRESCRYLRQWQDAGLELIRISVNVSLIQFLDPGFTEKVGQILQDYNVNPENLTLEITESVFEHESIALKREMQKLHDMRVRLSLDDFGTGYSALRYLQQYYFDEIKIDRSFVMKVLDDKYSQHIVSTVIGIAGALGAEVVAEGIEDAQVGGTLLEMGCRIGQGFYYSLPLEAADFRWLMEKHSPLPLGRAANE